MEYYCIFTSLEDCEEALALINKKRNYSKEGTTQTWAHPLKNQITEQWAIPYDERSIGDCKDDLNKGKIITKEEAETEGWYFGFFEGPFAREREKLEDVHFIFDALVSSYGNPNHPATRSLILSFLSACYALKESLDKKFKKADYGEDLKQWWIDRKAEQNKNGELLHEYHIFMNTAKHGGAYTGQRANIKLEPVSYMTSLIVRHHHPHADPQSMVLSSEGAFMTAYKGTPMERRFPVGIHEASYEIRVRNAPKKHLGQEIEGTTLLDQLTMIRNYYMQVLHDAERMSGMSKADEHPSIEFSGTQHLGG